MSIAALEVAREALDSGVHGGQPARFRGPEIDIYLSNVGLDAEYNGPNGEGYPWCAAFVYSCFKALAMNHLIDVNPCPRTASALHLFQSASSAAHAALPAPGDVFVLVHPDGIHGHCGFVESCSPGGDQVTTIEGDTNAAGSSTGDAVGRHTWTPGDGKRGRLLGYLAM